MTAGGVRSGLVGGLAVAGDLAVASLFWVSAFGDMLPNWPLAAGYVAAHGLPAPALVAAAALAFEIVAPALLFWRRMALVAALALAAYCVATAVIFHAFWRQDPGFAQTDDLFHFFKNVALAGALLGRVASR